MLEMGAEYKGIRLCVSRANLAQHVEGRSIAVDGGVPPWYRPPWARREPRCQVWCEMAFCMKKDEDHLPGRISIAISDTEVRGVLRVNIMRVIGRGDLRVGIIDIRLGV